MWRPVLTLVVIALSGPALAAGGPPVGVYSCYDVRMAPNAPGCVRSAASFFGMLITPMPVVMFGLIDGATYANYDGQQGRYRYDPGQGVIEMIDGPRQGWRYKKTDEWSFTMIDNNTGKTIYTCPLETSKDPHKGPW